MRQIYINLNTQLDISILQSTTMSMIIKNIVNNKLSPDQESTDLEALLEHHGCQSPMVRALSENPKVKWAVATLELDTGEYSVLLYACHQPVCVLTRPEGPVPNNDDLREVQAFFMSQEPCVLGQKVPLLALIKCEDRQILVTEYVSSDLEPDIRDAHDRLERLEVHLEHAVTSIKSGFQPEQDESLSDDDQSIDNSGAPVDLPQLDKAPQENAETTAQEFIDEDFYEDFVNDSRIPVQRYKPSEKKLSFFNTVQEFTLEEQLCAMRRDLKMDQWEQLGNIIAHFTKECSKIQPADAQYAYQIEKNYHFLTLLFGNPAATIEAYNRATKCDQSVRYRTIKSFKTLDTISSRLAQSHDHKGTVMRMSPQPRGGEMDLYLNFFSKEHPVLFTAKKFMPVLQARCNEFNTVQVRDFIKKHAETRIDEVPETLWLTHELTDQDLDLVADVIAIKDTHQPGTFAVGFGTQGGNLFAEEKEKPRRFVLDPLAALLADGLQFIYYLKNIYKYDASFRNYWNDHHREKLIKRQADKSDYVAALLEQAHDFFFTYRVRKDADAFGMVPVTWDQDRPITDASYQELVDEYHHQLRETIKVELVEQGVFIGQRFITSIMPNDSLAIQVVNDLTMNGMNVEIYDAMGYVNVGHLVGQTCTVMRPRISESDKKAEVPNEHRKRYDVQPGDGVAVLDLTMHSGPKGGPRELYVGAGSWQKKISGVEEGETRTRIYFDYEPVESRKSAKTGRMEHTRVDMGSDGQWRHVIAQCDRIGGKEGVKVVGVIVPFRAAPLLFQRYNKRVKAVMPAPYPYEGSFYALVVDHPLTRPASLKHVYLMLQMKYSALFYSMAIYKSGYFGIQQILAKKINIFVDPDFCDMCNAWFVLLCPRFGWELKEERSGTASWHVKNDQSRLLRNDPDTIKRTIINANLLNRKKNFFVTRRKHD